MRLGLLADIHGNALALEAVLREATCERVEQLLIAGDTVGYYFEPLRVLELLSHWKVEMVRGNHEAMLAKAREDDEFRQLVRARYGSGLDVALQTLSKLQIEQLTRLPHPLEISLGGRRILLCHGTPWDPDYYLYPDSPQNLVERCWSGGWDIVVFGHTHYPFERRNNSRLLVNPGSVGQPRDRKPGAAWAILDTESLAVEFRRETYDVEGLASVAGSKHPDIPYLSEVLQRT